MFILKESICHNMKICLSSLLQPYTFKKKLLNWYTLAQKEIVDEGTSMFVHVIGLLGTVLERQTQTHV